MMGLFLTFFITTVIFTILIAAIIKDGDENE